MTPQAAGDSPLVSAVVATYNRVDLVAQTLDSILAQSYPNLEVIVVDDGSTDGTGEMIPERYGDRVRYFHQDNAGPSAARNRGIEQARGEYIAFLDDDDLWLPTKIEQQVAALERAPDCAVCYTRCGVLTSDGRQTEEIYAVSDEGRSGDVFSLVLRRTAMLLPTVLVRRAALDEVGVFDPALAIGEDTDLFLRLTLRYPAVHLRETLALVREHEGRKTRDDKRRGRHLRARVYIMAKLLDVVPRDREHLLPMIARRLVRARLDVARLGPAERSWDDLVKQLQEVWRDVAWAPATHELAQGTITMLDEWGRAHPDEAGDRLSEEGLVKLTEKLAVCVEGGRSGPRAARLYTALGLDRLKRRQLGGTSWLWRGLWRNFGASVGQSCWAATRWMRAD
jgi:glycosyltransferase involved in cell wall biosynthesis